MRRFFYPVLRVWIAVTIGTGVLLPLTASIYNAIVWAIEARAQARDPHVLSCECPRCISLHSMVVVDFGRAMIAGFGFLAIGVILLLIAEWWIQLASTRPPYIFKQCGYDLRGLKSDVCPECGDKGIEKELSSASHCP